MFHNLLYNNPHYCIGVKGYRPATYQGYHNLHWDDWRCYHTGSTRLALVRLFYFHFPNIQLVSVIGMLLVMSRLLPVFGRMSVV